MVKNVKNFLISNIQHIEEQVGLNADNGETIVNMALDYLFNTFDIGLALDSSEIIKERMLYLEDVKTVENFLEEAEEGKAEYDSAVKEGRTVSSYLHEV